MPEPTALPSVMQQRRAQLEAESNNTNVTALPATDTVTEAPVNTPSNTDNKPPVSTATDDRVTISREEFNELQAAADRVRAVEGREEARKLDLEALTARLTELEAASKGSSTPASTAPAAAFEPVQVQYTDDENKDYGESKPFVEKVATEVFNKLFSKAFAKMQEDLLEVKSVATNAAKTATTVKANSFVDKVKEKVKEFDEIVNHKHWAAFSQSMEPNSGLTYAECIANNDRKQNLEGMVKIFDTFKQRYGIGVQADTSGYAGAAPSGTTEVPQGKTTPKKLPFSVRRDAHRKFINKEISYEEYEKIKTQYDEADRDGLVDYDN